MNNARKLLCSISIENFETTVKAQREFHFPAHLDIPEKTKIANIKTETIQKVRNIAKECPDGMVVFDHSGRVVGFTSFGESLFFAFSDIEEAEVKRFMHHEYVTKQPIFVYHPPTGQRS